MKTLILSLLFIVTLSAQNIWYVNRDATGSENGTSWNNAWKSPSNINWNNISAGDTIYISGGSDSTVYVPTVSFVMGNMSNASPRWTFSSGNPVVVAPAWHSGHNGEVWFAARNTGSYLLLAVANIANIKITGFNFIDQRASGENGAFVQLGNGDWGNVDSLIYFENNYMQSNGLNGFLYLAGAKSTVRNNYMEQISNNSPNDQDPIGMSTGRGGHTVDNNIIIMRNYNAVTEAHRDGIQISNLGDSTREFIHQITISNNLIIDENPNGVSWNNMIYNYGGSGEGDNRLRLVIYNNILVGRKYATDQGGIAVGRINNVYPIKLYILNNTMILKGEGLSTPVTCWGTDSLVIKNNLMVIDTSVANLLNLDVSAGSIPMSINYNHYAELGGSVGTFNSVSWATWQGQGHDANSSLGNSTDVIFENKYGIEKEDYYTGTGRSAGQNLWNTYPFLRTDALGNPRPESGDWDIGALQYQGGPSINVKGKVFLQGPFTSNSMSTGINQGGFVPNSQPYNQSPWNYGGNESFNPIQNPNVVDWVLVELRNASNPSLIVARRAALLQNNGLLLETNGTEGVIFNNVQPGNYYIAVFHRNHLAIMSAAPVQLSLTSVLYDFTNAMNKAYGQNPMVELSPGKYGMFATDGNADGVVNTSDRDNVWFIQNGNMGYLEGDFNMNSGVTIHDVNQLWNFNNGITTQVP